MDIYVLDQYFKRQVTLDRFENLVWAERYCDYCDFSMDIKLSAGVLSYLSLGGYLEIPGSNRLMAIEEVNINFNRKSGAVLHVTGKGVEYFLERRIIWGQKVITGSFQDSILSILNENVISPTDTDRAFPNFLAVPSTNPDILNLVAECQYAGDNVFDVITDLCLSAGIGYRVVFNPPDEFLFELYIGTDRTHNQSVVDPVIFSNEFDNLISSSYKIATTNLRTVALVAGEGEWPNRTNLEVVYIPSAGYQRRELFVDAPDVSSETEDGEMTDEEYADQLAQRGVDKLSDRGLIEEVNAEIDPVRQFIYGTHFFLGDIVEVVTELGISKEALVSEYIRVIDGSGERAYPTFKLL